MAKADNKTIYCSGTIQMLQTYEYVYIPNCCNPVTIHHVAITIIS